MSPNPDEQASSPWILFWLLMAATAALMVACYLGMRDTWLEDGVNPGEYGALLQGIAGSLALILLGWTVYLQQRELTNPPLQPGQAGPIPSAMGLRTLPLTWDLSDLALEPHERAVLASAGGYVFPDVPTLRAVVERMARRGHGWLDVEALAMDPRFQLHALVGVQLASLRMFKQAFRAALGARDPCYPVRLPYGIVGLSQVPGSEPGEQPRYCLTVREAGRLHEVTLSWDTLVSNAATARAIGRVLQQLPPLAPAVSVL